jgi:hypothetical protein
MKLSTKYGAFWAPADEGRKRWDQNVTENSILWITRHDLSFYSFSDPRSKNAGKHSFGANKSMAESHVPNTMLKKAKKDWH